MNKNYNIKLRLNTWVSYLIKMVVYNQSIISRFAYSSEN